MSWSSFTSEDNCTFDWFWFGKDEFDCCGGKKGIPGQILPDLCAFCTCWYGPW